MSETSQELQGLLYDEDELDEFSDDVEQQRERSYERERIESSARGHSWRNLVLVLLSGMALILLARSFARGSVESSPETAQQQQDQRSQQQDQSGQSQQWSHPVVTTSDPYDTHEETPDDTSSVTGSGNVSSDNDDWQIEFAHIGYRRPITYEGISGTAFNPSMVLLPQHYLQPSDDAAPVVKNMAVAVSGRRVTGGESHVLFGMASASEVLETGGTTAPLVVRKTASVNTMPEIRKDSNKWLAQASWRGFEDARLVLPPPEVLRSLDVTDGQLLCATGTLAHGRACPNIPSPGFMCFSLKQQPTSPLVEKVAFDKIRSIDVVQFESKPGQKCPWRKNFVPLIGTSGFLDAKEGVVHHVDMVTGNIQGATKIQGTCLSHETAKARIRNARSGVEITSFRGSSQFLPVYDESGRVAMWLGVVHRVAKGSSVPGRRYLNSFVLLEKRGDGIACADLADTADDFDVAGTMHPLEAKSPTVRSTEQFTFVSGLMWADHPSVLPGTRGQRQFRCTLSMLKTGGGCDVLVSAGVSDHTSFVRRVRVRMSPAIHSD